MEVFKMRKDTPINLRVRREQLNKIHELGYKNIDCWELGFERICENERSELEKLVKKYHDLYTHVNTRLENFGKKLDSENAELDRLLIWFRKADRSITHPTGGDIDALRHQLKKREIHSYTVEQVLEYWRNTKKKEEA
jgi:hypothetical protein